MSRVILDASAAGLVTVSVVVVVFDIVSLLSPQRCAAWARARRGARSCAGDAEYVGRTGTKGRYSNIGTLSSHLEDSERIS